MKDFGLSVATNFDDGLLDALSGYPVTEIFGKLASDAVGGGRASFTLPPLPRRRFERHVAKAKAKGIGFNYLLNPACMDNREFTRQGQREIEALLAYVESAGVSAVTISLPSLLPVIKKRHPGLKVRVGVYARVDGVTKARYWEDEGADCITLESLSVNRDFRLLAALRKALKIELQLIVNANCQLFCPLSGQHMVNLSHASQKGHASRGFLLDWCVMKCSYDKLKDPAQYLRSEFIRPEDLGLYRDLGYDSFKVLERGAPTPVLAKRVKAYSEGRYEGNLLDLIQPFGYREKRDVSPLADLAGKLKYFFRPQSVRLSKLLKLKEVASRRGMLEPLAGEPVCIDNRQLTGFLQGFQGRDCRSADCSACGWCASYARKAVRVDEVYRAELMKLYEEVFADMTSGAMWGIRGTTPETGKGTGK
ncbi:MAG: U32 family peptidase [Holophagales bacterium]|nr:U32 family peptidase [Holophagales bacterium]